jgi:hypothetical protein
MKERLMRLVSGEMSDIVSKQLVRSGTSIGANVEEATAALCGSDLWHLFPTVPTNLTKVGLPPDYGNELPTSNGPNSHCKVGASAFGIRGL